MPDLNTFNTAVGSSTHTHKTLSMRWESREETRTMDDITKIGLALGIALIGLVAWRVYATASLRGKRSIQNGHSPRDSAAYQQFFSQYINSDGNFGAWHDGLDERVFAKLPPAERERAESALLQTLPDWRSVIGLGYMR